jgi:hypothetical protein
LRLDSAGTLTLLGAPLAPDLTTLAAQPLKTTTAASAALRMMEFMRVPSPVEDGADSRGALSLQTIPPLIEITCPLM